MHNIHIEHNLHTNIQTCMLKLLNGMSFLLSGQLLHSWHPSTQLLIGIFSRRNGCFPHWSHRGLKSCKLFILMIGYLLSINKKTSIVWSSLMQVLSSLLFIYLSCFSYFSLRHKFHNIQSRILITIERILHWYIHNHGVILMIMMTLKIS